MSYFLHFTSLEHTGTDTSVSTNQWEGEEAFESFKDAQLAMVREAQRFFRNIVGAAKNIRYRWENDHARKREIVYTIDGKSQMFRVTIRRDVNLTLIMNNESPVKESFSDCPRD